MLWLACGGGGGDDDGLMLVAARAVFQLVGAAASPTIGNILIPAGWLPFVGAYSYAVRALKLK